MKDAVTRGSPRKIEGGGKGLVAASLSFVRLVRAWLCMMI